MVHEKFMDPCNICGCFVCDCSPKRILQDVKIDSVSVVAAPKYVGCREPMKGYDSMLWNCINTKCDRSYQPVAVDGVYPFVIVKERLEAKLEGNGK
jgi:hypothetical protein